MAEYLTIAIIHILVGFEMSVLGLLNMDFTGDETVEALMIIGFLLFLASVILVVLIKGGDLGGNMIAMIFTLVMVLVAGVLLIAGSAIWYDNINTGREYAMTLDCTGGIMAVIGGIFLIVQMAGGGGGGTSPA